MTAIMEKKEASVNRYFSTHIPFLVSDVMKVDLNIKVSFSATKRIAFTFATL